VDTDGELYEIQTAPHELHAVAEALEKMGLHAEEAKLTMQPKTTLAVDTKQAATVLKMMEALEEHDDVKDVFSNLDITEEAMAAAMAE